MINGLEIQNFRCFEKTNLSGFNRINLIGGKNNSGKTALLEAIYLNSVPGPESINFLRVLRRESSQFLQTSPKRAWDSFFFNQDKSNTAEITLYMAGSKTRSMLLSRDDSIEEFHQLFEEEVSYNDELVDLRDLLSGVNGASVSTLHLSQLETEVGERDAEDEALIFSMAAHAKGISKSNFNAPDIALINFIPTPFTLSNRVLAQEYDNAYLQENSDKILRAIQSIDKSIIEAKTLSIGEPTLYLKREGQNFLPISLFGEAINRVVNMLVRLVNNPGGILLVDEIENGIHHTSQPKLWEMLFKLSVEFEIQIFAATHSLEMIEAFRDVGLEAGNENVGAYFEMVRNIKTGQITGVKHKLETLDYELKREKAVRGEQRFNR